MTFLMNRSVRPFLTCLVNHSSKVLSPSYVRYNSSNPRPLMLMDLPRIVYPNLFLTIKNFFARMLITNYFDSTFAIKSFSDGARQALTVVSHLIGNGQFDLLSGFVTQEVEDFLFYRNTFVLLPCHRTIRLPMKSNEIILL